MATPVVPMVPMVPGVAEAPNWESLGNNRTGVPYTLVT
ncbi:hypothetical protein BH24ACT5_BH24ACT5_32040 [soil metagenome]